MNLASEKTIQDERRFRDEVMAMKCPNCGVENPDNASYCGSCATQLREISMPMSYGNDPRKVAMARRAYAGTNQGMEAENLDNAPLRQSPWRDINWIPLMIVIASMYLVSVASYGTVSLYYGVASSLAEKAYVVLSFLAGTIFILTIALVVYRRVDLGKISLIIGMAFLILMFAIRASVFLGYA